MCARWVVLSRSKSQKSPTLPRSNVRHVANNDVRAVKITGCVQNPITRLWCEFQVSILSNDRDIVPQSLCHAHVTLKK